jgi:hypothetical protein
MIHKHSYEGAKAFLKRQETMFIVNVGQFPSSWIRIRIPNMDLDPGQPNECGSMRIRIHNTASKIMQTSANLQKPTRSTSIRHIFCKRGSILNFIKIQAAKKPRSEQKTSYSNFQVIFFVVNYAEFFAHESARTCRFGSMQ